MTGVQTCALPICLELRLYVHGGQRHWSKLTRRRGYRERGGRGRCPGGEAHLEHVDGARVERVDDDVYRTESKTTAPPLSSARTDDELDEDGAASLEPPRSAEVTRSKRTTPWFRSRPPKVVSTTTASALGAPSTGHGRGSFSVQKVQRKEGADEEEGFWRR